MLIVRFVGVQVFLRAVLEEGIFPTRLFPNENP